MPTAKKPSETDKVMDVNNPGTTAPSASSRPVIVSHKPMIEDPMVSGNAQSTPTAPPLAGKGRTIQPAGTESEPKTVKKTTPKKASPKPEEASTVATDEPAPVETEQATEEPVKEVEAEKSEVAEKPTEAPAENPDKASAPSEQEATDAENNTPEKINNAKVAAEAKAAKEREEKFQQLIEDKTYFVPIDQSVSSSTGGKIFMILLTVVLLGLICAVLVIDAGIVETSIDLPFDLIQN